MELSKRVLRQVENLSKTYEFDMEKRVATIPLYYDSPEELIDIHLSSPGKPVVSDDAIDYLCEVVSYIPKEFDVDFKLIIDDYGDYNHDSLMNALRATLEDTFYYYDEDRKKNNVLAIFFIILGILMLALETVGGMTEWYGVSGGLSDTIIETILDVLVWVFAWEGAALLFLTYGNDSTIFGQSMRRFNGISFLNKQKEVLCCLDENEFYKGWIYLSGKEVAARNYILFSNAALFAVISILTVEVFAGLEMLDTFDWVTFLINWILIVLLVFSNMAFYREKGRLRNCAFILSVVCLLYTAVFWIYNVYWDGIFSTHSIGDFVLIIMMVINMICIRFMSRQNVEI